MLEDRRLAVLRAIVDDYVATHEPVGSKALVERSQQVVDHLSGDRVGVPQPPKSKSLILS